MSNADPNPQRKYVQVSETGAIDVLVRELSYYERPCIAMGPSPDRDTEYLADMAMSIATAVGRTVPIIVVPGMDYKDVAVLNLAKQNSREFLLIRGYDPDDIPTEVSEA